MALSKTDQQNYYNLSKGYEGEQLFDALLHNLECDCLVLNDLLLLVNNQTFQVDTLLIMNNRIHLFEIKNYTGDFYFESNQFFRKDRFEISNPLTQLQRTESLLRQWLIKFNYSIPIQASVIFINPGFTLYNAPLDKPFILPTQLNLLIKKLNSQQSILNKRYKNLAEKLVNQHISEHPLQQMPSYEYHQLQKGLKCGICESFSTSTTRYSGNVTCLNCGNIEKIETAVLRTLQEFRILFPLEKITTNKSYEWCNIAPSKKTMQRILGKHFKKIGTKRWSYYS
ncbi:nuclease-related domain-containing protein [Ureibacillus aquaedulcis]|uniref:Nuclease-related domain-containing protein n=1 Tax=Ureibacillus aquaedulcis TaxID=3058421 RepID=A0ABT8GLQ0_9BACL|nr:nuclease-related domain-containing protein [Ureibacillus sp. BA0131]MDN4492338.1 nuclease-related domain-containing protein [Ureibacillus sp. BA0131]